MLSVRTVVLGYSTVLEYTWHSVGTTRTALTTTSRGKFTTTQR